MSQPGCTGQPKAVPDLAQPEAQQDAEGVPDLSEAQLLGLQDEAKQAEYRRLYLLQLEQRRGCPGCGD